MANKTGNANLSAARSGKKDEFYTQLTDIEKEMRHYRKHFKGKVVLCNCDDPFESNFFKYFALNFNRLKLKKLIATCYEGSAVADYKDGKSKPYKAVINVVHDTKGDGGVDMTDVKELFELGENKLTELKGDGDFRSEECKALLDEADIVVTNPPFSLFREYVKVLMERGKKFIILGNVNAVTYKDFFPYFKRNEVWIGASIHSGDRKFYVPDSYPLEAAGCGIDDDGRRYIRVKGVRWFTNLDMKQRHEELILVRKYNTADYPKYDDFDAIEVGKVADIPYDYDGVMGVPITFLDKYNPEQFDIIWLDGPDATRWYGHGPSVDGKKKYRRILIRKKRSVEDALRAFCNRPLCDGTYDVVELTDLDSVLGKMLCSADAGEWAYRGEIYRVIGERVVHSEDGKSTERFKPDIDWHGMVASWSSSYDFTTGFNKIYPDVKYTFIHANTGRRVGIDVNRLREQLECPSPGKEGEREVIFPMDEAFVVDVYEDVTPREFKALMAQKLA